MNKPVFAVLAAICVFFLLTCTSDNSPTTPDTPESVVSLAIDTDTSTAAFIDPPRLELVGNKAQLNSLADTLYSRGITNKNNSLPMSAQWSSSGFSIYGSQLAQIFTGTHGSCIITLSVADTNISRSDSGTIRIDSGGLSFSLKLVILDTSAVCDSTQDYDGDGLNDCDEMNVYGTSWRIADTDGDGMSDKYEVMEANFNPLVAEMPLLDIEFTSSPYIHLTAQETNVDEELLSTQMSKSYAQNVSTSRTVSWNTQTMMEQGIETSMNIGIKTLFEGASITSSSKFGLTMSREASFSSSQAAEARQDYGQTEQMVNRQELTLTGGEISVDAVLRNIGTRSFRLTNLTVNARVLNPVDGTFQTILTLSPVGWTETTIGPLTQQKTVQLKGTTTDYGKIQFLRRYPRGLVFEVANFDMQYASGDYAFTEEDVYAKTALVVIDYGGYRDVERYLVATNVAWKDGKLLGVAVAKVMKDIIEVPYTVDSTTKSVTGVRNLFDDASTNQHWVVVTSAVDSNGLGFNGLTLKAGGFLDIMYIKDNDGDGVAAREEFLYGARDDTVDTDGDGLSDYEEIKEGWRVRALSANVYPNPVLAGDYDGDSLDDAAEKALGTDPYNADTDGDGIYDDGDPDPNVPQVSSIYFRVLDTSFNSAKLGWHNPADTSFAGVVIFRLEGGNPIYERPQTGAVYAAGDSLGQCVVVYSGTDTMFIDTNGVNRATDYTYRLFMVYKTGGYGAGISLSITTQVGPMPEITPISAVYTSGDLAGNHTITLSWANPGGDDRVEDIIIVRRAEAAVSITPQNDPYVSDYSLLDTVHVLITRKSVANIMNSYVDDSLESFRSYHYRIYTAGATDVSAGVPMSPGVRTQGKVRVTLDSLYFWGGSDAYNAGCACYRPDPRLYTQLLSDKTPVFNAWYAGGDNLGGTMWRIFSPQSQNILAESYFEVQYWWIEDDTGDDDWILAPNVLDDVYLATGFATMEGSHLKSVTSGNGNVNAWYTVKLLPLTPLQQ